MFRHLPREMSVDVLSYGSIALLRVSISFVTLPFLVNSLTAGEYAALDLVNAVLGIFQLLILHVTLGTTRYYWDGENPQQRLEHLASSFWGLVVLSVSSSFIGIFVLQTLTFPPDFNGHGVSAALLVMFCVLPPLVLFEFFLLRLRMEREKGEFAAFAIGESLLRAILMVSLVIRTGSVAGYFWAILISASVFVVLMARRADFYRRRPVLAVFMRSVRYALPAFPGLVVNCLNQYGSRFLVLAWLSFEQLAIFAFAVKFAIVVKIFIKGVKLAWRPIAMRMLGSDSAAAKPLFRDSLMAYVGVALVAVPAVSLLSAPVIDLIAPVHYASARQLVPLIVATVLLSGAAPILEIGIEAAERTFWHSIAITIGVLAGLLTLGLLVAHLGPMALAINLLVTQLVSGVVVLYKGQSLYHINHNPFALSGLFIGLPLMAFMCSTLIREAM